MCSSDLWPGRCRVGWKLGGAGEKALWPCAFSAARCRRAAADDFCGLLQSLAALSPRRLEVRRRRWRLGSWAPALDPIEASPGCSGCLVQFAGSFCVFLSCLDLLVSCSVYSDLRIGSFPQKKKEKKEEAQYTLQTGPKEKENYKACTSSN